MTLKSVRTSGFGAPKKSCVIKCGKGTEEGTGGRDYLVELTRKDVKGAPQRSAKKCQDPKIGGGEADYDVWSLMPR